jgi:hypothetical protein
LRSSETYIEAFLTSTRRLGDSEHARGLSKSTPMPSVFDVAAKRRYVYSTMAYRGMSERSSDGEVRYVVRGGPTFRTSMRAE